MLKTKTKKTLLNAPRVSLHLKYIFICIYIRTFWSFLKVFSFFPFKLMMEEHFSFSCLFLHISNPSLCLVNRGALAPGIHRSIVRNSTNP